MSAHAIAAEQETTPQRATTYAAAVMTGVLPGTACQIATDRGGAQLFGLTSRVDSICEEEELAVQPPPASSKTGRDRTARISPVPQEHPTRPWPSRLPPEDDRSPHRSQ